ncbi:hypothetical protein SUNI508_02547 [Seiridium unicorne]|uniref:Uncharacterized protein n=1 Tax=Seiridium unicorne TaxID=138068 RepID=A0ABR2UFE5_9PEZI
MSPESRPRVDNNDDSFWLVTSDEATRYPPAYSDAATVPPWGASSNGSYQGYLKTGRLAASPLTTAFAHAPWAGPEPWDFYVHLLSDGVDSLAVSHGRLLEWA